MIPEGRLSTTAVPAGYIDVTERPNPLIDYEMGGVALNDSSQGLRLKLWTVRYNRGTGAVLLSAPGVAEVTLFTRVDVTELSLAFDQNMNPFVAFVQAGQAKFWWYDPTVPGQVFAESLLPATVITPRCTLDDKRLGQVGNSDIVLAYMRSGSLYYRLQRERYLTEHLLRASIGGRLLWVGMNRGQRLQFKIRGATDPAVQGGKPFLADVVKDLLRRDGIAEDRVDVEDLWFEIDGYKVAIEGGANVMIQPLQTTYFFDPGEWDGRLHFIKRGAHEPVATLGPEDLVERDGPAIEFERVQEAELLRKVNVISVDPEAGYTPTSQSAERRSSLIRAKGEATIEVPLTLPHDVAAQVADKRLKVAWSELQKLRHAVTVKWSHLTATDTIWLMDKKGAQHRIRLMDLQEDTGVIDLESSDDAPWAYDSNATGVQYRPPVSTTPGLVGQTLLEVLNIAVMRDQDDEPGVYIAALGTKSGWYGAEIEVSTDGGATNTPAAQIDYPATIGYTVTALAAEVSSEYLSPQTLRVSLPDAPSSVDYETLLRYFNRAAVKRADGTWEVLQYQTVTAVDATTFDLSGLVRGRYATAPLALAAGAVFVLIDDALVFVQAQQWMIGQPMQFRGVSYGESADGVAWQTPNLATIASQTEWPVHSVSAARDGSDAVTVRWVGRARLGAEIAPHHSKYFRGWRVAFSDGFTADTIDQQYTRASTPPGATVTVAPINHLTGLGPASESIPT